MIDQLLRRGRRKIKKILIERFPIWWKEKNELAYWKKRKNEEKVLGNGHYEFFYTEHFGIEKAFYNDKVILDIGCGPRGSLEWASNAKRAIGLDPLAKQYLKLGANKHKMEYIASGSENIPLEDSSCDAIFSFNSLDHVENVNLTVNEIKRCLVTGGTFLLLLEINHKPTACEPHKLSPKEISELFNPEFKADSFKVYIDQGTGIYGSIKTGELYDDPLNCPDVGWLSVKFTKSA